MDNVFKYTFFFFRVPLKDWIRICMEIIGLERLRWKGLDWNGFDRTELHWKGLDCKVRNDSKDKVKKWFD